MPRCEGCPCAGLEFECPAIARPAPGLCARQDRYAETLVKACLAERHPLGTDRTNGRTAAAAPIVAGPPVPAAPEPWPASPRDGRIRVGLALPMVYLGGMEAWGRRLGRSLDPARFVWVGTAAADGTWRHPLAESWLSEVGPLRTGPGTIESLARAVDVLIVSGVDRPAEVPPGCRVLMVAHGEAEWTRQRVARAAECAGLAAVSAAARDTFPADQRERVKVIPNCYDPERLEPKADRPTTLGAWGVPDDAKVALYLGRLSAEKRPLAFVDMIRALPPDWRGVMLGIGAIEDQVKAAAAAPELAGRVVIPGPTDDVGGALAAADIGVVPSEQEGCCLAALEMLAAGLPVVATPVGDARTLAGLITLTGPLADGPELAAAVQTTLADPGLEERRKAAQEYVRRVHGPEAFAAAWSDLIAATARIPGVAHVGDGVYVTDAPHCGAIVGEFDLSIHLWRPENLPDSTCDRVRSGQGPGLAVEYRENDALATMRPSVPEVAAYMRRPGRLLIHCFAGQCRAPTLAMLARIVRGGDPDAVPAEVRTANLEQRGVQTDLPPAVIEDIRACGAKLTPAAIRERSRRLAKARKCPDRKDGAYG